ncbi:MAG TPA: glycosyltransferase [Anaerolineae bacterium]|nr:glycosyltransferase [Anaerolineae bacterium]
MRRRLLYVQYSNPGIYPPLQHSAQLFAQAGWDVLVLGIQDPTTRGLQFPMHARVTVKLLPFVALGWRRIFYFLYYTIWIWWWALRWQPNVIYASDLYATPAAFGLSYLSAVRVIYHEHDTPQATRRLQQWCMKTRARVARRAFLCIVPNERRAERFARELGVSRVLCVWNCPMREQVPAFHHVTHDDALWVLFFGSIVPARKLETVLNALARLPACVKLRVIGYETVGHPNYMQTLREQAARLQLNERVEFHPPLPRAALLKWAQQSDVGLVLMPCQNNNWDEQTMSGASNKPFDYLACGLPLLVSDLPDWHKLFVEPGFARACNPDDVNSVTAALQWFLEHPAARRTMGDAGQRQIRQVWNYETQFAPVLERLG